MKKYVLVRDEEIKIGDTIEYSKSVCTPLGVHHVMVSEMLTEDNLQDYIDEGIIKVVEDDNDEEWCFEISKLITALDFDINIEQLNKIREYCPSAFIQLILKMVQSSLYGNSLLGPNKDPFDRVKGKDLKDSFTDVYSISTYTGKVIKIPASKLPDGYIPYVVFLHEEDAKLARKYILPVLKKYGKKE